MPLQVNIFILLFGALQGLLVMLFFIKRKLYSNGYVFLLLYFAAMMLQIAMKVLNKVWLMQNWAVTYEVSYFLPLVYGPLVFLFVRTVLTKRQFRPGDLLHFAIPIFLLVYLLLEVFSGVEVRTINILYRRDTGLALQWLSIGAYHWMAFRHWTRYRGSLQNYFSDTHRLQMNWIRHFIMASLVVCGAVALALYLIYVNHPQSAPYRYVFAVLSVFIYWVSYKALTSPSIFTVIKSNIMEEHLTTAVLPMLVVHRPPKKYANSGLAVDEKSAIINELQKLMRESKPYLNATLTINDLADMVKCPRHHLSQALNEILGQSFYDYVNQYRIGEARLLLLDPAREEHKIASIAYDAGFNSLSTFNDVFKKLTGLTPSQYKKQHQPVSRQQWG